MASSLTMTASFLGGLGSTTTTHKHPSATTLRRTLVVAKAASAEVRSESNREESRTMRRDLVFATAAAAAWSVAKAVMAEEEPKRGSLEAKKKYAPICVSMPTASICRK